MITRRDTLNYTVDRAVAQALSSMPTEMRLSAALERVGAPLNATEENRNLDDDDCTPLRCDVTNIEDGCLGA